VRAAVQNEDSFANGNALVVAIGLLLMLGIKSKGALSFGARRSGRTVPELDRNAGDERHTEVARVEPFDRTGRLDDDGTLRAAQRASDGELRIVDFVSSGSFAGAKDSSVHSAAIACFGGSLLLND
jgi:hypothetical protein